MSWAPERLLEDVETKPAMLRGLATALRDGTGWPDLGRPRAVLLLGIGSSRYAAEVAARRMRSEGIAATAESSSIARMSPIADDTLVVVISAGGSSAETLAAARAVSTSSRVIGLTNAPSSVLAEVVGWAVPMDAGEEVSGVASRTFTATLVRLLELEVLLTGGPAASAASPTRRMPRPRRSTTFLPSVLRGLARPSRPSSAPTGRGCWRRSSDGRRPCKVR